ncbi:hypothetical protein HK102_005705 [Quaeritorhiza haematococci]|nr:hypothetical protein HK102_005705 [Quaeritorhiza haematococci]
MGATNMALSFAKMGDVLVVSAVAKSEGSLAERIAVSADCWAAGISADYALEDHQNVQSKGYLIHVLLKGKASSIKVKNMVTETEAEVSRPELMTYLLAELETLREHSQSAHAHVAMSQRSKDSAYGGGRSKVNKRGGDTDNEAVGTVNIIPPPWTKIKLKQKQKMVLEERALNGVSNHIKSLSNVNIFVIDLPVSMLSQLKETTVLFQEKEDGLKVLFPSISSTYREYLLQIRKALLRLYEEEKQGGHKHVWLYSIMDNAPVLISLSRNGPDKDGSSR